MTKEFIPSSQACERLGISKPTLHEWRKSGLLPNTVQTEGGHFRFSVDDVLRILKERTGKGLCQGKETYKPLMVDRWLMTQIPKNLRSAFAKTDPLDGNVVSAYCNILDQQITFSFTTEKKSQCPFRTVQRHGLDSFVLKVGFLGPPTLSLCLDGLVNCLDEELLSILFVLRASTEYTYSAKWLRILPLTISGAFWLKSHRHNYILRLPKVPTMHEWKVYNVKLLMIEEALRSSSDFEPPDFTYEEAEREEEKAELQESD